MIIVTIDMHMQHPVLSMEFNLQNTYKHQHLGARPCILDLQSIWKSLYKNNPGYAPEIAFVSGADCSTS